MTRAGWTFVAIAAAGIAATGSAQAQDVGERYDRALGAPQKSAEIGVGFGLSRGTGNLTRRANDDTSSILRTGGEVNLEGGYRINPRWMIGLYGGYGEYQEPVELGDQFRRSRSVNGGVQVQFHMRPMERVDPWIGLGSGYRGIYRVPEFGNTAALHGFQIARARVGIDFRASTAVAVGPVLGVDATMFTAERTVAEGVTRRLDSDTWTVTPFFFGGIAGRFDIVNEKVVPVERTLARAY